MSGVSFPSIKKNQSIFLVSGAKNALALDLIGVYAVMLILRMLSEMTKGTFTWSQLFVDALLFSIPLSIVYAFIWYRLNRVEARIQDPIGTDIFHQKVEENERKDTVELGGNNDELGTPQ